MPDDRYVIPAAPVSCEEVIRKSRFITYLAHAETITAARAFVQQRRQQHSAARHCCSAWVAGPPGDSQRYGCSDDGEPSGTAGRPMLTQLIAAQVGEICAVVVRYYGGIRLGTGGLVRAYSGGVSQALQQLRVTEKRLMTTGLVACDYASYAGLEKLLSQYAGEVLAREFGQQIRVRIALPVSQRDAFAQQLAEISRGALRLASPECPQQ